jgi:hypothetical protein
MFLNANAKQMDRDSFGGRKGKSPLDRVRRGRLTRLVSLLLGSGLLAYSGGTGAQESVGLEKHLQETEQALAKVDNYTSLFRRVEFVDGKVLPEEVTVLKFKRPFKIYMRWISPSKGQESLYVQGANNNKHRKKTEALPGTTTPGAASINTETKREKPFRHCQRPCAVGFVVPTDWDDTKDRQFACRCIGEPEDGNSWRAHCLEHVAEKVIWLRQGLDQVIGRLVPGVSANEVLLETMTTMDKIGAVRKLVAKNAAQLLAEEQSRMVVGCPVRKIGDFLDQAERALDQCECAEALRGRVLTHYAVYGEDVWLMELVHAGDWIATALIELAEALPIHL